MAKITFDVCIYWDGRCLEQEEVVIEVPDEHQKLDVPLTMLYLEQQMRSKLNIEWKEKSDE